MSSPNSFSHKTVNLDGRNFSLQVKRFDNGAFVSISEGPNRLGSIVASLATGPAPVTTTIIPSRSESLFLKLTAEQISARMHGIALVSVNVQKDLTTDTAKALMSEIVRMVDDE